MDMKMKPCPHCGRTKELFLMSSSGGFWNFIECYRCHMRGPKVGEGILGDGSKCLKAWNDLPRNDGADQIKWGADFFEKQMECDDVLCPINGEKPLSYKECADKGWPCVACFREWAMRAGGK